MPPVLRHLDDDTLAQYALPEPTETQLRVLCRPGAVHAFIRCRNDAEGAHPSIHTENPVGRPQKYVQPRVPSYVFTQQEGGLLCEVCVDNFVSSAKGANKRMAKSLAAMIMPTMMQTHP